MAWFEGARAGRHTSRDAATARDHHEERKGPAGPPTATPRPAQTQRFFTMHLLAARPTWPRPQQWHPWRDCVPSWTPDLERLHWQLPHTHPTWPLRPCAAELRAAKGTLLFRPTGQLAFNALLLQSASLLLIRCCCSELDCAAIRVVSNNTGGRAQAVLPNGT